MLGTVHTRYYGRDEKMTDKTWPFSPWVYRTLGQITIITDDY